MIHLEAKLSSDSHSSTLSTATLSTVKKRVTVFHPACPNTKLNTLGNIFYSAYTLLPSAWSSRSYSQPTVSVASPTWTSSIYFTNYSTRNHPQAENDNELLLTITFTPVIIQCWHLGHTYPHSKIPQWGLLVLLIKGRSNWFCFICFCLTRISNSFNT